MNRIQQLFQQDKKLVSVYFTAGYPKLDDTIPILEALQESGVDLVEIGLPYSDPLADGPTIQASATQALKNGMTTELLFQQLELIREKIHIPLILMGYFNPILQFGVEKFCKRCEAIGIDGIILPDLPLEVYLNDFKELFEQYDLFNILLITPSTSTERIRMIDQHTKGFLYMVSSASTTGKQAAFGSSQREYFTRIDAMKLKHPKLVGFGIYDKNSFQAATEFANGAIVGSAYIKFLTENPIGETSSFVSKLR
ncbi:tryptophan synthase subunit alpha [Luteirhabdus pelagi]|uniref:tryptophan synthase subunit alpha n=1 Tax=Luteirhabdus pelagi TaxID=2792783 RepID=UPI0019397F4B|nr:tryptophan synthase subunit alpha [Luteirhabdus pelagi]